MNPNTYAEIMLSETHCRENILASEPKDVYNKEDDTKKERENHPMAMEFEVKYRADAAALAAIEAALPGDYKETHMTTTYYDNPKGDFSRRRWTLRHRCEGDSHVCTLKTPGSGSLSRSEYEWNGSDIQEAIPYLAKMSGFDELAVLVEDGLQVIGGARFTRRSRMLTVGGTVAELALDSGVLTGGDREVPFAEMEVELKNGHQEEVLAIGLILSSKFGLTPEPRSKFARARELGGK